MILAVLLYLYKNNSPEDMCITFALRIIMENK
jgi:hypothetical protein